MILEDFRFLGIAMKSENHILLTFLNFLVRLEALELNIDFRKTHLSVSLI